MRKIHNCLLFIIRKKSFKSIATKRLKASEIFLQVVLFIILGIIGRVLLTNVYLILYTHSKFSKSWITNNKF